MKCGSCGVEPTPSRKIAYEEEPSEHPMSGDINVFEYIFLACDCSEVEVTRRGYRVIDAPSEWISKTGDTEL